MSMTTFGAENNRARAWLPRWLAMLVAFSVMAGCTSSTSGLQGATELLGKPSEPTVRGQAGEAAVAAGAVAATARTDGAAASADNRMQPVGEAAGAQLRSPTIILYLTETGNDGLRVPSTSLSPPIRAGRRSANGSRVEVATIEGPRWILASEIVEAPGSAAASASNPR